METRVAVLAIIVRGGSSVQPLNELLHQYGQYIIGRMGVPYREKGREYHQRGARRAGQRHLRPVGQDRPSGRHHRQNGLRARGQHRKGRKPMKKNLKYLLALCLTIALVFSLAACGQKADETTERRAGRPADRTGGVHPHELLHRRAQRPYGHGPCEADEGQRKRRNDWQ